MTKKDDLLEIENLATFEKVINKNVDQSAFSIFSLNTSLIT